MKKFSIIKDDTKDINNNLSDLQLDLEKIVENNLNVLINGELDQYLDKNLQIDGKNKVINILVEYVNNLTYENSLLLIEKIRYQGLDEVEQLITEKYNTTPGEIRKHKMRIESLIEKPNWEKMVNVQANAIKNGEKAFNRAMAADQMRSEYPDKKKQLGKIHDVFLFRSQQLGYRK